jgi:hypothetical protein
LTTGARQLVVHEAGGDDAVAGRIVALVVDADDDVEHAAGLDRRGDDDALRTAVEVALQRLRREELAGALQHHVHPELTPRDLRRARVRGEGERALVDADRVLALGGDVGAPLALHGVEGEQVRGRRGAALELVEVDHVQPVARARVVGLALGGAEGGAQRQTTDAAHAIDADSHAHSWMN